MARKSTIKITQSIEELQVLSSRESNYRIRQRIKCLIFTKEGKFKGQLQLAHHLGVDYATVKRWLKQYREEGLTSLILIKNTGTRPSVISPELHNKLFEKMNDSKNPLRGYWDAVLWVKSNHCIDLKYTTLREYLIRNFKTKLKEPRKSHYKKDEQAIEAFKKTTILTEQH